MALAIVLQRCAIHVKAFPNTFCRAVQELFECLTPVVKEGNLFNIDMEILEEARKGLMTPTSLERALSLMPRVREPTSALAPHPPPTYELEGALFPEELALVLRRWPSPPPRFAPLGADDSEIQPLEDMYRPVAMSIGSMLDLAALVLLQMTVLHTPATGEVHYHLQIQSITRMSLPSTSSPEQWEPSLKIEEL